METRLKKKTEAKCLLYWRQLCVCRVIDHRKEPIKMRDIGIHTKTESRCFKILRFEVRCTFLRRIYADHET